MFKPKSGKTSMKSSHGHLLQVMSGDNHGTFKPNRNGQSTKTTKYLMGVPPKFQRPVARVKLRKGERLA